MRIKVFKNGPCKICGNQSLKNFTWTILKYGDSSIYLFFHLFIYLFIYLCIYFIYLYIHLLCCSDHSETQVRKSQQSHL